MTLNSGPAVLSPDGTRLAFTARDDVDTSGSAVRLGVPHALFSVAGVRRAGGPYDVTADGKKFLINSGDVKESSEPITLVVNWPAELKR